jgi:hypothetical protein
MVKLLALLWTPGVRSAARVDLLVWVGHSCPAPLIAFARVGRTFLSDAFDFAWSTTDHGFSRADQLWVKQRFSAAL